MIKRSFIGLFQPRLSYDAIGSTTPELITVTPTGAVQLLVERIGAPAKVLLLQKGDKIKTGQKLVVGKNDEQYAISPGTGTVSGGEPQAVRDRSRPAVGGLEPADAPAVERRRRRTQDFHRLHQIAGRER